ncbi:MFS transporter [Streptomyces sp. N2-109]|uniref:MFS transporter n=1 Tax=Streptomyces gossypii TaxID=2883101 RepID=A0ABT2JSE9_9ACTN|nr:MFS transporter [Streptomyces gossypii]MCT2590810.1 MFS transporter [Streptomyces gossypii]
MSPAAARFRKRTTDDATDRDFRRFWWAGTTDALGTQTSGLALPLLLLALGESPAVVGTVAGVSAGCGILAGPFAAVLADRGARRTVMVLAALTAATAMASVAAGTLLGDPPLWHLFAAVLVERTATSCQEAASAGTVAVIVPPDRYPQAVSRLQAGEQAGLVVGPALGGALFQLGRWLPFLADALSYLVSALCVAAMRSDLRPRRDGEASSESKRPSPAPRGGLAAAGHGFLRELGAGAVFARRQPFLRFVLLWSTVMSVLLAALSYGTLFTLRDAGAAGGPIGAVLAVAGAAGLAGALLAPRLARALPGPRLVVTVSWLLVAPAVGLALTTRVWVSALLFGLISLLLPAAAVVLQSRAIQVTPQELQSRTGTVLATTTGLAAAAGPVAAGALEGSAGTGGTALSCAAVLALLALWSTTAAPRVLGKETA